jgi:hypothetical protein
MMRRTQKNRDMDTSPTLFAPQRLKDEELYATVLKIDPDYKLGNATRKKMLEKVNLAGTSRAINSDDIASKKKAEADG